MGYRMYLAKAKKGETLVVPDDDNQEYLMRNSEVITTLYEMGKYVEWRPDGSSNLLNEDEELFVVNKEFLLYVIEAYRILIREFLLDEHTKLAEVLLPVVESDTETAHVFDEKARQVIASNLLSLEHKVQGWHESRNLLTLEPSSDGSITSSWLYEYAIFNLVHILHTFDWENDDLIYMGY